MRTLKRNHANQIGLQRLDALEQGIANEPHVGTHGGNRVQQGEAVHGSEGVVGGEHDASRTRNSIQVAGEQAKFDSARSQQRPRKFRPLTVGVAGIDAVEAVPAQQRKKHPNQWTGDSRPAQKAAYFVDGNQRLCLHAAKLVRCRQHLGDFMIS